MKIKDATKEGFLAVNPSGDIVSIRTSELKPGWTWHAVHPVAVDPVDCSTPEGAVSDAHPPAPIEPTPAKKSKP